MEVRITWRVKYCLEPIIIIALTSYTYCSSTVGTLSFNPATLYMLPQAFHKYLPLAVDALQWTMSTIIVNDTSYVCYPYYCTNLIICSSRPKSMSCWIGWMKTFLLPTTLSMNLGDCEASLVLRLQHRRSNPPHPSNLHAATRIFWIPADIQNYDLHFTQACLK